MSEAHLYATSLGLGSVYSPGEKTRGGWLSEAHLCATSLGLGSVCSPGEKTREELLVWRPSLCSLPKYSIVGALFCQASTREGGCPKHTCTTSLGLGSVYSPGEKTRSELLVW